MPSRSLNALAAQVRDIADSLGRVQIMEVCGTHTVALFRSGLKSILPPNVRLVSGPGCPVCVTSQGYIDAAITLATMPEVTVATYGDMVRVPGRSGSLEQHRAQGANVRVVYSPRDAIAYAAGHPDQQVVFLAVGFETTAPGTAAAIREASSRGLDNFTVLMGHKLVIPAMSALLAAGDVPIDGFLCPGHVSVVIGSDAYVPIAEDYHKPCVVAGFEPAGMLRGILQLLEQVARRQARVENVYGIAVTERGNETALRCMSETFEPADTVWRAMGTLPGSGLELREPYAAFDAARRFDLTFGDDYDPPGCRCGEVIQGKVEPAECTLFANECTPAAPVGPCMVSSEGTCAAWYKYGRHTQKV